MTPVNFNRHIFILNKLILQGPKSLVELRNEIKDELEAGSTCEIDKKSLKRVVENLKRKQLAKSVDFSVTISGEEQALEQTKTVVIPFDMDPSDPRIQRNPTIQNPTNRLKRPDDDFYFKKECMGLLEDFRKRQLSGEIAPRNIAKVDQRAVNIARGLEKLNFVAQGKEQQVLRKFNNHWKFRSMALSQESQKSSLDLFEIKRQPQIFDLVLATLDNIGLERMAFNSSKKKLQGSLFQQSLQISKELCVEELD